MECLCPPKFIIETESNMMALRWGLWRQLGHEGGEELGLEGGEELVMIALVPL